MKYRLFWSVALVASLAWACGSSAVVTGSYVSPSRPATAPKKIFVSALVNDATTRAMVEERMANALKKKGFEVVKSIDVVPVSIPVQQPETREVMVGVVKKTGADAVLVMALVKEQSETRYVPGSTYPAASYGYYGGYYGYYGHMGGVAYSPGYYTTDNTYFIESNLYDVASEQLVWSAQSEVINPSNREKAVAEHTEALTYRMQKDKIIP
ncbi:hypothetical protein GC167_04565 [bacterium]|nr:hypothetical protein [bacterium]